MKERMQRVLCTLDDLERASQRPSPLQRMDARAKTAAATLFLVTMLSVPLAQLSELLLYALFPIAAAAAGGIDYGAVCRRSLIALPFAAMIGLFNPICLRDTVFSIGGVNVTEGWITFASILVRGMLSVQILIVLIRSTGYLRFCRSLQRLGVPAALTAQLLFVFRYIRLLSEETLEMLRARDARGYGRRSYPIGLWAETVGQLLLRTLDRAEHIHNAMLARGFTGRIPAVDTRGGEKWRRSDTLVLAAWCAALLAARTLGPAERLAAQFI